MVHEASRLGVRARNAGLPPPTNADPFAELVGLIVGLRDAGLFRRGNVHVEGQCGDEYRVRDDRAEPDEFESRSAVRVAERQPGPQHESESKRVISDARSAR